MSEVHADIIDEHARQAAARRAEGGKHRGPASSAEEAEAPVRGRHRRIEQYESVF